MAKLTRQAQQIFAGQAPSDMIAAFGSTQTGTPVYSTDLSTLQTTNYQQGWQDAIIADKAPFLEEMNGVQYGLSYQIAYAQQMGIPEWLSTQDYYINSRAIGSDGNIYKSLTDSNTGNNPVLDDGTNWVLDTTPEANVLNYITNCITSAPNGVPSYSGTTVTVQEGTNYLFPNGRNSNNQIQNVNFSLASAVTGTISGSTSATYCVFVTSELDLIFVNNVNYFITNTQPTALNTTTTAGVWFNPQTNLIYQCAATASIPSWSNFKGAICATLGYDGSTITGFSPIYPISLLAADYSNDPKPYITETYVNGASGYRIWSNNFCEQWGINSGTSIDITLLKPYKDTNYIINLFAVLNINNPNETKHAIITNKTKTGFKVYVGQYQAGGATNPAYDHNWFTLGYIRRK